VSDHAALARDDVHRLTPQLDDKTHFGVETEAMIDVTRQSNFQIVIGAAVLQSQVEGVAGSFSFQRSGWRPAALEQ
jgi:hypothetical protein